MQVHGRKRVLLFPPSQWQQLYLFPLLHPAGRSAQIDLDTPRDEQPFPFPHFEKNHTMALEVVLEPGQGPCNAPCVLCFAQAHKVLDTQRHRHTHTPCTDRQTDRLTDRHTHTHTHTHTLSLSLCLVHLWPCLWCSTVLYIPPLWFHHVTSLEPSVSLSVWTPHIAIEIAAKVLCFDQAFLAYRPVSPLLRYPSPARLPLLLLLLFTPFGPLPSFSCFRSSFPPP